MPLIPDTLKRFIPGMEKAAPKAASEYEAYVAGSPAMRLSQTGRAATAEADLSAMGRYNRRMAPEQTPEQAQAWQGMQNAEDAVISDPAALQSTFSQAAQAPAYVPSRNEVLNSLDTPLPPRVPEAFGASARPEEGILASPAMRPKGFPNAKKSWQARNILHKMKMRDFFEDGHYGEKLLEHFDKPGARAEDLSRVLFEAQNDFAAMHVWDTAMRSTLDRAERILGTVDRQTLAEALAIPENAAAAKSVASMDKLTTKAKLQQVIRYSYGKQLTDACLTIDEATHLPSFNPDKLFKLIGNGIEGNEKAIYGSQELRALKFLGKDNVEELRRLGRYMTVLNNKPAANIGHNVMAFRMLSTGLAILGPAANTGLLAMQGDIEGAKESAWTTAKVAVVAGGLTYVVPGTQARLLTSAKGLKRLNDALERIAFPAATSINKGAYWRRAAITLHHALNPDAPLQERKAKAREAARGPSLPKEQVTTTPSRPPVQQPRP